MGYSKQFGRPDYYDHVIMNGDYTKKIGTLRVKPVGILWKPANSPKFYNVSLDEFIEWITDPKTEAKRTKS